MLNKRIRHGITLGGLICISAVLTVLCPDRILAEDAQQATEEQLRADFLGDLKRYRDPREGKETAISHYIDLQRSISGLEEVAKDLESKMSNASGMMLGTVRLNLDIVEQRLRSKYQQKRFHMLAYALLEQLEELDSPDTRKNMTDAEYRMERRALIGHLYNIEQLRLYRNATDDLVEWLSWIAKRNR